MELKCIWIDANSDILTSVDLAFQVAAVGLRRLTPMQIDLTPEIVEGLNRYIRAVWLTSDLSAAELRPFSKMSTAALYRLLNGIGTWTPDLAAGFLNLMVPREYMHGDALLTDIISGAKHGRLTYMDGVHLDAIFPTAHSGERLNALFLEHEARSQRTITFQNEFDFGLLAPPLVDLHTGSHCSQFDIEKYPALFDEARDFARLRRRHLAFGPPRETASRIFLMPLTRLEEFVGLRGKFAHMDRLSIMETISELADFFVAKERLQFGVIDDRPGRLPENLVAQLKVFGNLTNCTVADGKRGIYRNEYAINWSLFDWADSQGSVSFVDPSEGFLDYLCHPLDSMATQKFLHHFLTRSQVPPPAYLTEPASAKAPEPVSRRTTRDIAHGNLTNFLKNLDEQYDVSR